MPVANKVLIKLGENWSTIGCASIEQDDATGAPLLHLRLSAMAQDLYVSLSDTPAQTPDLDEDEPRMICAPLVGHA